jgi:hypothetical protein
MDTEMDDIFEVAKEHGNDHEVVRLPLDEAALEAAKAAIRPHQHDFHTLFVKYGYTALIDAARFEAEEAGHKLTQTGQIHSGEMTDLMGEYLASAWSPNLGQHATKHAYGTA